MLPSPLPYMLQIKGMECEYVQLSDDFLDTLELLQKQGPELRAGHGLVSANFGFTCSVDLQLVRSQLAGTCKGG